MCGVLALFDPKGGLEESDLHLFKDELAKLRHRGPDFQGLKIISKNGLGTERDLKIDPAVLIVGMTRLAIQDVSERANRVFEDSDSGSMLVLNGELYNASELRTYLKSKSLKFSSNTDTEVLLLGLKMEGISFLKRCRGMWAFIYWDNLNRKLTVCRDRFGQKPLYFAKLANNRYIFSSEIKSIRAFYKNNNFRQELIWDFLRFGFADHSEHTFYSGIDKVMPGTYLEFSREKCYIHTYYKLEMDTNQGSEEQIRSSIQQSVTSHMNADVPIFSFLSGGLDSSIITLLADKNKKSPEKLIALTNTYDGLEVDQPSIEFKNLLSETTFINVNANKENFHSNFEDLLEIQDEPFNTTAIFAAYRMFQFAKNELGAKVVLVGDGADELFGGYVRVYASFALRDAIQSNPWLALAQNPKVAAKTYPKLIFQHLPFSTKVILSRKLLGASRFMTSDFMNSYRDREEYLINQRYSGSLKNRLFQDFTTFNLPHILRYLDKNSMRFSIEARAPFLEKEVVETAFSGISPNIKGDIGKVRLRQAYEGFLPKNVIQNSRKTGFGTYEQYWFNDYLLNYDFARMSQEFIDVPKLQMFFMKNRRQSLSSQQSWLAYSILLWLTRQ